MKETDITELIKLETEKNNPINMLKSGWFLLVAAAAAIVTFPKGNGVEQAIIITTGVYTLDTWQANGGRIYVNANNTCDIYEARLIIHRVHKAG